VCVCAYVCVHVDKQSVCIHVCVYGKEAVYPIVCLLIFDLQKYLQYLYMYMYMYMIHLNSDHLLLTHLVCHSTFISYTLHNFYSTSIPFHLYFHSQNSILSLPVELSRPSLVIETHKSGMI